MSDLNTISVTGRVGSDPQLQYTEGGKAYLRLRVAVNRRVKERGEWVDRAIWLSATLWEKRAESLANVLRKGSRVGLSGQLEIREYETRDGEKRLDVGIDWPDVALLDPPPGDRGKRRTTRGQGSGYDGGHDDFGGDFGDDSIPFQAVDERCH